MLDKFFKLSEKGTTVKTEILAGDERYRRRSKREYKFRSPRNIRREPYKHR